MKTSKKTKTDAMCGDFKEVKQQSTIHRIEALTAAPQEVEMTWKVSEIKLTCGYAKNYLYDQETSRPHYQKRSDKDQNHQQNEDHKNKKTRCTPKVSQHGTSEKSNKYKDTN